MQQASVRWIRVLTGPLCRALGGWFPQGYGCCSGSSGGLGLPGWQEQQCPPLKGPGEGQTGWVTGEEGRNGPPAHDSAEMGFSVSLLSAYFWAQMSKSGQRAQPGQRKQMGLIIVSSQDLRGWRVAHLRGHLLRRRALVHMAVTALSTTQEGDVSFYVCTPGCPSPKQKLHQVRGSLCYSRPYSSV